MRRLFLGLGLLALVAWGVWYMFVTSIACAFVTSGRCSAPWPWELRGFEDIMLLLVIPGTITGTMFALSYVLGRSEARAGLKDNAED